MIVLADAEVCVRVDVDELEGGRERAASDQRLEGVEGPVVVLERGASTRRPAIEQTLVLGERADVVRGVCAMGAAARARAVVGLPEDDGVDEEVGVDVQDEQAADGTRDQRRRPMATGFEGLR